MALYVLESSKSAALFGTPMEPTPKSDLVIIGQTPDCSAFLVMSDTAYPELSAFTSFDGFDFTYCQSWGLTVNDEVVSRVWADVRAKADPSIADQLDTIFHSGLDAWKATIQSVKDKHPKV